MLQSSDNIEASELFPNEAPGNVKILEFQLSEHKPLGCTAEESLDETLASQLKLDNPPVFISSLVDGGNAQKAGLMTGDVVLAVSGLFGDVIEDIHGLGLDRLKSLVSGRPHELPLTIRVARGTSCRDRHESALMKLCEEDQVANEKILSNTINSFFSQDYFDEEIENKVNECSVETDESDCMIDAMCALWGEECEVNIPANTESNSETSQKKAVDIDVEEAPKKKQSSYFSRSSPSGTYIRDPATGKMENVDA